MRKWIVKLPDLQLYTLVSDTPTEDLSKMGYDAFALMELDAAGMKRWWKYPPVPAAGKFSKSRRSARKEGDTP